MENNISKKLLAIIFILVSVILILSVLQLISIYSNSPSISSSKLIEIADSLANRGFLMEASKLYVKYLAQHYDETVAIKTARILESLGHCDKASYVYLIIKLKYSTPEVLRIAENGLKRCLYLPTGGKGKNLLAKIQGHPVTEEDIDRILRAMKRLNLLTSLPAYTAKDKKKLLKDYINALVMAKEALNLGLMENEDISEILRISHIFTLAAVYAGYLLDRVPEPTDSEIKKYYHAHIEEYMGKAKIKVSIIKLGSQAAAISALEELAKGKSFEEVARMYSQDLKLLKLNKGYTKTDTLPIGIEAEEIFDLPEGEYTRTPIYIDGYFYIVKVTKRLPPEVLPLKLVKNEISKKIRSMKYNEILKNKIKKLYKKYKIEFISK